MAKILGWFKKRPSKHQTRFVDLFCCGWILDVDKHDEHKRMVEIEAKYNYYADELTDDVTTERLHIRLLPSEARALVAQILEHVERMEKE